MQGTRKCVYHRWDPENWEVHAHYRSDVRNYVVCDCHIHIWDAGNWKVYVYYRWDAGNWEVYVYL